MKSTSDIIRAPVEHVYALLVDIPRRTGWKRYATEAQWADGAPAAVGSIARFSRNGKTWTETVTAAEPPQRFEVAFEDGLRHEWRLQPINLGTLAILTVHASNPFRSYWASRATRWKQRRLLRELKKMAEAPRAPAETPPQEAPGDPVVPKGEEAPLRAAPARTRSRKK